LNPSSTAPQTANYRPKEKVGENPPDNASEDPSKMGDYTRRTGRKQASDRAGIAAQRSASTELRMGN
jgi:hypothetical protein